MYWCEAILIGILASLGFYTVKTDILKGIIPNKYLMIAVLFGVAVNVIYYSVWAQEYVAKYFFNLIMLCIFSICMYVFHFWAAGDSKLLITFVLLYPSRFYNGDVSHIEIEIIINIFLIAYMYILFDTFKSVLKKERFYGNKVFSKKEVNNFIKKYIISYIYLRGFSYIFQWIFGELYNINQLMFVFANVFLAMLIHRKEFFGKWYSIAVMLIINIIFYERLSNQEYILSIVILLFAFGLRYFTNGYNYQEISTDMVSKGMVLSYFTINKFRVSRVKGLPQMTTEDMSSRITEEEAFAIKRWENSKYGEETIVIVKKIPFAIFIVIGFFSYFIIRMTR